MDPRPDILPPMPTPEEDAVSGDPSLYASYADVRLILFHLGTEVPAEKKEAFDRLTNRIGEVDLSGAEALGFIGEEIGRDLRILLRNRFAYRMRQIVLNPKVTTGMEIRRAAVGYLVVCFRNDVQCEAWARISIDAKKERVFLRTLKMFRYRKAAEGGRGEVAGAVTALFDERSGAAEVICMDEIGEEPETVGIITIPFGKRRLQKLIRWRRKERKLEKGSRFAVIVNAGRPVLVRSAEAMRGEIRKAFGGDRWKMTERGSRISLVWEEHRLRL